MNWHPLRPKIAPDPGPFLAMDEAEYRRALIAWGYTEQAADSELQRRRAYLERLKPPRAPLPTAEELLSGDDPATQAVLRRRLGSKARPITDIEERPPTYHVEKRSDLGS